MPEPEVCRIYPLYSAVYPLRYFASNITIRFPVVVAGVIAQTEFVPKLTKMLQETPDEVVKTLEELRSYGTFVRSEVGIFLAFLGPPPLTGR